MKYYLVINCFLFIIILLGGFRIILFSNRAELLPFNSVVEKRPYQPVNLASENRELKSWDGPECQSPGKDWVFEVFTPPIIFFDPRTSAWTLEPPVEEVEKDKPVGFELLVFQRELYRLQYNGYLVAPSGGVKDTMVLIDNLETEKGIYGRVGQRFEDDHFYIRSFDVMRYLVQSDNSNQTPYFDENIRLVVFDERLGEDITLTGNKKRYKPQVKAVIRMIEDPIQTVTVGEGESFIIAEAEYKCVEIDLANNSVRVRRNLSAPANEVIETLIAKPGIDGTTLLQTISDPAGREQNKLESYPVVTTLGES